MTISINIALILILGVLAYQDFRHRAVSWVFLVLLAALLVTKGLIALAFNRMGSLFLMNSLILIAQFFLLIVYFRMKGYAFRSFWENVMGAGDFLFLLCVCLAFSPFNYIFFLLGGLFFTLIGYGLMRITWIVSDKTIPFAGLLSLFLILFIIGGETLGKWNGYDNELVLNLIRH